MSTSIFGVWGAYSRFIHDDYELGLWKELDRSAPSKGSKACTM
jgi:hypothetical protein